MTRRRTLNTTPEERKRLLRCVIAILLLFGALFYFSQQIYSLVAAPLRALS